MKKIEFIENDGNILVEVNGVEFGYIKFNNEKNLFQLETTSLNGNEVIDYYEDLKETQEEIKLEIENY